VYITSTDAESSELAVAMIKEIVHEPEVGEEYDGKVVKITQFGAFIKLTPTRDGLLHVSNICERRVERVEDCLAIGDVIRVKVREIDEETGKISLTRRGLEFPDGDPVLARLASAPPPERRDRYDRGGERHDRGGERDDRPRRDDRGGYGGGGRGRPSGGGRDRRSGPPRDSRDRNRR